jgi:hypothetical protein
MICGIPPGTLEDDAGWSVDLLERALPALWALDQVGILKVLLTIKLDPARRAPIRVDWHASPQNLPVTKQYYIALTPGPARCRLALVHGFITKPAA